VPAQGMRLMRVEAENHAAGRPPGLTLTDSGAPRPHRCACSALPCVAACEPGPARPAAPRPAPRRARRRRGRRPAGPQRRGRQGRLVARPVWEAPRDGQGGPSCVAWRRRAEAHGPRGRRAGPPGQARPARRSCLRPGRAAPQGAPPPAGVSPSAPGGRALGKTPEPGGDADARRALPGGLPGAGAAAARDGADEHTRLMPGHGGARRGDLESIFARLESQPVRAV